MKILHLIKLSDVDQEQLIEAAKETALSCGADGILFENEETDKPIHQDEIIDTFSTDSPPTDVVGFVKTSIQELPIMVRESYEADLQSYASIVSEEFTDFPVSSQILQIGADYGQYAAVNSIVAEKVYVLEPSLMGQDLEIFNRNSTEAIRLVDNHTAKDVLTSTEYRFEPNGVSIIDPADDVTAQDIVRHLTPGFPTPIILHQGHAIGDQFRELTDVAITSTEPLLGWFVMYVTPTYTPAKEE